MAVQIDAKLAAQLAQDAYQDDVTHQFPNFPDSNWSQIANYGYYEPSNGAKIVPDISGGGAFRVLVNDTTKQIVFAFKGSTFHKFADGSPYFSDWKSDLFDNGSAVVDNTVLYASKILGQLTGADGPYAGYNVTSVGHSLGGAEAQTFALANSCNSFVYDSLPVSSSYIKALEIIKNKDLSGLIADYTASGHATVSTYFDGEIATFWYSTILHGTYLDNHPTPVPSTISAKSWAAAGLIGAIGRSPVSALLTIGLIKGIGHKMGNLTSAIGNYQTDPNTGRLIIPGAASNPDVSSQNATDPSNVSLALNGGATNIASANVNGNSGNFSFIGGTTGTLNENSDGSISDQWRGVGGQNGTENYNVDNSSSGKIVYGNGGYATYINDGEGNSVIDYYTKNGHRIGSSWVYSDGSSGTDTELSVVMTAQPDGKSDLISYGTRTNPDGSYLTKVADTYDKTTTITFDQNGQQLSKSITSGTGVNFDFSNNTETTLSDGQGGTITRFRDAAGHLTHDTWLAADGSYGTDTFNASGTIQGRTVNADQSADTFSLYESDGALSTLRLSQGNFIAVHGPVDLTHDHYNAGGVLERDDWTLSDGSSGSDTFNSDGSGSGSITHVDGTISSVNIDAAGDITVDNRDAQGNLYSENWWHSDGTHGTNLYGSDGTEVTYTYAVNGTVLITQYAADGTELGQQSALAGAVLNPDGASFGRITNSDGTRTVCYSDANGDALLFQYGVNGQLEGTDHTSNSRLSVSDYPITLSDGTSVTSPYSPRTPVIFGEDGTKYVLYMNNSGIETGQNWFASDGRHGTDIFNADGSSHGTAYEVDGSSSTYMRDAQGNFEQDLFGKDGTLINDIWFGADGSHGSDTNNTDGSSKGAEYHANGSYSSYVDDGAQNRTETDYSATGIALGDRWIKSDGEYGDDQLVNSVWLGTSHAVNGDYSKTTKDSFGNTTLANYTNSGALTGSSWSNIDGTHGSTTIAADGSSIALAYNRDGSYTKTSIDAGGDTLTGYYSSAGVLLSDTWHHSDGTSGQDNYSGTQSNVTENFRKDGVYAVTRKAAKGETIIDVFGSDNVLLYSMDEQWDLNGGNGSYGGGYGGDYGGGYGGNYGTVYAINTQQVTHGVGGILEIQSTNSPGVHNEEIFADGTMFHSLWRGTDSSGLSQQTVVSRSTRDTAFDAASPSATSKLAPFVNRVSPSGELFTVGQTVLYRANSAEGWQVVRVPNLSSLSDSPTGIPAWQIFASDVHYSAGGEDHYVTQAGIIVADSWSDGHGGSGYYVDHLPPGGYPW